MTNTLKQLIMGKNLSIVSQPIDWVTVLETSYHFPQEAPRKTHGEGNAFVNIHFSLIQPGSEAEREKLRHLQAASTAARAGPKTLNGISAAQYEKKHCDMFCFCDSERYNKWHQISSYFLVTLALLATPTSSLSSIIADG